jgi:predicted membrane chloride channel (bestrophin family)
MTATFIFFFLFTVPFALLSDDTGIFTAVSHCVVVFIFTYGVMGMELIAIQLDDPFGDDVNDFK